MFFKLKDKCMSNLISKRSNIKPFLAIEMLTKANKLKSQGRDIVHMDVGEPGLKLPDYLIKYIQSLLGKENIGYTESIGTPLLRDKISNHYEKWYEHKIEPTNIAVTSGASGAFVLALLALFDVGDEIAIMTPYYPAYVNTLKSLGLKIIFIEGDANHGFQPTLDLIKKNKTNLKGLVIASPANPTGSVLGRGEMILIAKWCKENNIKIISDEIYHGIEYEGKSDTILSHNENAVIINSFSKYFNMTGWRLGWMVASKEVINVVEKLSMALFLCPSNLAQKVAIKVINDYSILDKNILIYKKSRNLLIDKLKKVGLDNFSPTDGAFYLYLDVSKITSDSRNLALRLLYEAGVSCTPGHDFDYISGNKYLRFSYAGDYSEIKKAADRITNWVEKKT